MIYLFAKISFNILRFNAFLESTLEDFEWTSQTTKLLLTLYQERKAAFCDPKTKKKKLWLDIFVIHSHKRDTKI